MARHTEGFSFVIRLFPLPLRFCIFDNEEQDTHSGGSGCGCAAVTLAGYILHQLESNEWKRVLFVPTGALLSTVSFNEGQTIPGVAHAVVIEHIE